MRSRVMRATSESFIGMGLCSFGTIFHMSLVYSPHSPPDLAQSIGIWLLWIIGLIMIVDDLGFSSKGLSKLLLQ